MLKGFSLRQGGVANNLLVDIMKLLTDLVSWGICLASKRRVRKRSQGGRSRR